MSRPRKKNSTQNLHLLRRDTVTKEQFKTTLSKTNLLHLRYIFLTRSGNHIGVTGVVNFIVVGAAVDTITITANDVTVVANIGIITVEA